VAAFGVEGGMKKQLMIAMRFTIVTTLVFGLGYPLLVTGLSQWLFPAQANGSLIQKNGQVIGSHLIGQSFAGDKYFHSRRRVPALDMTLRRRAHQISDRQTSSSWTE
jgi:K+-transporting ATPase KdpC subunit